MIVRNIIKRRKIAAKRRKGRKFTAPFGIQMADILANRLYNGYDANGKILSPNQLFNHPKSVSLDEDTLVKVIREARRKNN